MKSLILLIFSMIISLCCYSQTVEGQTDFDALMKEYGLVDIEMLDDEILVELKYSTTDNFVGEDMYLDLERAYLEESFAERVVEAQRLLKSRYPEYTLLIYDAARPISVQRYMRSIVEGTPFQNFVADGSRGGRHNYGVAVDLTIAHADGTPLDMGAGFDDFSDAAAVKGTPDTDDITTRTIDVYREYVNSLALSGVITFEAAHNRILLLKVMCEAGLVPYRREWWHFEEIISIDATRKKYRLLNF